MREITFQEVGMENYGPYIDPMIHTFTNNTITLMTGPNGIGKTMSLDAIPFTFYGITSKGARGDDVINNVVGRNCHTWVNFTINEDQYKVNRYQKYTKLGNTVLLNKNGVDIKKGHKEVLPEIERLICPSKSFMNTLMFGQKVKDFFTDLVDSDKKEIFRKILMLEIYIAYYKETDKRLKATKNELDNLSNQGKIKHGILEDTLEQIVTLKALEKKFYKDQTETIAQLKKDLEDNERLSDNWKKEVDKLEQTQFDVETLTGELAKINADLENLDVKYQVLFNDLNTQMSQKKYELKSAGDDAAKKVRDVSIKSKEALASAKETVVLKLREITDKYKQELHNLDINKNDLSADNRSNQSRINEINSNVLEKEFSSCPTCEQDVNDETRESLMAKVQGHEENIATNNKKIASIETQIKTIKETHIATEQNMSGQIEASQGQIDEIEKDQKDQQTKINERLTQTFTKVDALAKQQNEQLEEKAKQEKADLIKRQAETDKLKSEATEHQLKIDGVKGTIKNLENGHVVIESNIKTEEEKEYDADQLLKYQQREIDLKSTIKQITNNVKSLTEVATVLEFWKTGFSSAGMPSMLIDESIPFMNQKVTEYLDMLTNGRYIVSFDTLAETKAGEFRDKISVRVLDTHTQANSRVQLSGGQTRIVDIATILTLGELQANMQDMKINILLFDEIFDALDDENIGYVAKVLNKLKVGKSIFIISHQHQDQVEADQMLALS